MPVICRLFSTPLFNTLARELQLDCLTDESHPQGDLFFMEEKAGLIHLVPADRLQGGPIACDFTGADYEHYRKTAGIQNPLAKAVGCKPGFRPTILDTTAGFAKDSFILASMGCKLSLLEKNPVVYLLLFSGLSHAMLSGTEAAAIIDQRITLLPCQSSIHFLATDAVDTTYDTVYIDPMFPIRKKSSKVKKGMQYFHQIVGVDDNDSERMFSLAMAKANNRVVIKRPKGAPGFIDKLPDYQLQTKTLRFDIYLKQDK